jgi:hypothetical protein
MKSVRPLFLVFSLIVFNAPSQSKLDEILPIRGVCIGAPTPDGIQPFIDWIKNDLKIVEIWTPSR